MGFIDCTTETPIEARVARTNPPPTGAAELPTTILKAALYYWDTPGEDLRYELVDIDTPTVNLVGSETAFLAACVRTQFPPEWLQPRGPELEDDISHLLHTAAGVDEDLDDVVRVVLMDWEDTFRLCAVVRYLDGTPTLSFTSVSHEDVHQNDGFASDTLRTELHTLLQTAYDIAPGTLALERECESLLASESASALSTTVAGEAASAPSTEVACVDMEPEPEWEASLARRLLRALQRIVCACLCHCFRSKRRYMSGGGSTNDILTSVGSTGSTLLASDSPPPSPAFFRISGQEGGIQNITGEVLNTLTRFARKKSNASVREDEREISNSEACVTGKLFRIVRYEAQNGELVIAFKSKIKPHRGEVEVAGEVGMGLDLMPSATIGIGKKIYLRQNVMLTGLPAWNKVVSEMRMFPNIRKWFLSCLIRGTILLHESSQNDGFIPELVGRGGSPQNILRAPMRMMYFEELGGRVKTLGETVLFQSHQHDDALHVTMIGAGGILTVDKRFESMSIEEPAEEAIWTSEHLRIGASDI